MATSKGHNQDKEHVKKFSSVCSPSPPHHLAPATICHYKLTVALMVENLPANTGDAGLIPGSGRSPGGGTVVLEKTLQSPLDCKEIKPVHPKENQP